ncbi:SDR family oxidoreductase [Sphingomonas baiyangensis]|uniref:SDR family NAD(P)-dependent oxidoreductase n=1 Tax=Sphingomonas baiyangensis TaxID=2572576 RepID=A0A4U1L5X0_9SPHN|nr:SDR family oxidoreductase [Sphingomonas baiyangensis]TKD51606.1 SDR family NAD(P)-dependent oxidoreductase [Sphingomonas baiyangensis]
MSPELKPLCDQVVVVTGATSGHGLCTAQMAAAAGARVMLAARDEVALRSVVDEIRANGGTADHVVTDVSQEADVARLAERTIERFGGFDTWVNNAGVGIYARILDMPTEDHRQLFETNYWGVVYGSIAATRHLKTRPGGGAVINVGSINGDMSGPVLAAYNASKHAIKGFTDALRIEMIEAKAPVSVTLIKPSAIGTPFPQHGRNLTGRRARLPSPLYTPDLVARAILDSAQRPRRSVTVGGAGKFQVLGATMLPWLFDRLAVAMADKLVEPDQRVGRVEGNLYAPQGNSGHIEGRQKGRGFSTFTKVRLHPKMAVGAVMLLGAAGGWAMTRRGKHALA